MKVGFFANIIHPLDMMSPYSFRVLQIHYAGSRSGGGLEESGPDADNGSPEPAGKPIRRWATLKEGISSWASNGPVVDGTSRRFGGKLIFSPLHVISALSFLMSAGLIGAGIAWGDGTAVVAISLISLASSVIGYAAWWTPNVPGGRWSRNNLPDEDIVILTREGAFILIKSDKDIVRELYSGAEECSYRVVGPAYRVLMTVATIIIMPSVILLGNCTFNMQALIGAAYMALNTVYWALGLLPPSYSWDLSRYEIKDVTPADAQGAHRRRDHGQRLLTRERADDRASHTRTLWYVIRETGGTRWVELSRIIPQTETWRAWLEEAGREAKAGNRMWPAVERKDELSDEFRLRQKVKERSSHGRI